MYNQIIEQLVEKINTKYCCLNGPFQVPGAPSLTVEREKHAALSSQPPLLASAAVGGGAVILGSSPGI